MSLTVLKLCQCVFTFLKSRPESVFNSVGHRAITNPGRSKMRLVLQPRTLNSGLGCPYI